MSDLFMNSMHHRHLNSTNPMMRERRASTAGTNSSNLEDIKNKRSFSKQDRTHADDTNGFQQYAADNADFDEISNILSLKLRKPKHWKWELNTSRSCTNIALPRILLYDHKGQLLVDANSQEERTYSQPTADIATDSSVKRATRKRTSRAATSVIAAPTNNFLDSDFNTLKIQEATPSPERSTKTLSGTASSASPIEFCSNELPNYEFESRSQSFKGVRFKEADNNSVASFNLVNLPTPPSTSTATTTTGTNASSSSGPREKRRYRRSRSTLSARSSSAQSTHSTGSAAGPHSTSILERFSFNKGRFSSPEYAEEKEVYHAPRYFLRTSKAGTLVVQEESFSRYRRRRKPKPNSSSENLQNSSKSRSTSLLKISDSTEVIKPSSHLKVVTLNEPQCGSLQNISEISENVKRKILPVRRYRSDGNILLQKPASTTDEEEEEDQKTVQSTSSFGEQHRRQHICAERSNKDLISMHAGNGFARECSAR